MSKKPSHESITMMAGFDYFDGNHRENFCAGLILLCLDEDLSFRQRFEELIRKSLPLTNPSPISDWGREVSLNTEQGELRRSDLWLQFGEERCLIEVKTHSAWDPKEVEQQVLKQAKSKSGGQQVFGAALLAPSSLLWRIQNDQVRKVRWREVLDIADTIEQPTRILWLAEAQWRCNVEPDFGLTASSLVTPKSMQESVTQTACLESFLRTTLIRLGGRALGKLYTGMQNGKPRKGDGWEWFPFSVSGTLQDSRAVDIGIYTYVKCPKGSASDLGMWLEWYSQRDYNKQLAFVRFNPPDLTHESLEKVLKEFVDDFKTRNSQGVTVGG